MSSKIVDVSGVAWIIDNLEGGWDLCHWACPTDGHLRDYGKPSSEARIIKVRIVPVDATMPPANTKRIKRPAKQRRRGGGRSK